MRAGRITVGVGKAVHRGQVLGRVGNTGSSAAPHLHFHITNSAVLALSNGVPYEFTGFRLTGKILNLEGWLGQEGSVPADIGPVAPPARRRGELPPPPTSARSPPPRAGVDSCRSRPTSSRSAETHRGRRHHRPDVEVTCVSSRPARWSLSGSDRLRAGGRTG